MVAIYQKNPFLRLLAKLNSGVKDSEVQYCLNACWHSSSWPPTRADKEHLLRWYTTEIGKLDYADCTTLEERQMVRNYLDQQLVEALHELDPLSYPDSQ